MSRILNKTGLVSIMIMVVLAACAPALEPEFIEIENQPAGSGIIYITPTPNPTGIPTIQPITPSPTATPTTEPTITPTEVVVLPCDVVLNNLYTTASQACLGQPDGYVCNGGLPPDANPGGRIASAMGVVGSLVDVNEVDMIHSAPLPSNNSGGVVYVRLNDFVAVKVLMVGDVRLEDKTPEEPDLPNWQILEVETTLHGAPGCGIAPPSAAVLQAPYGQSTRLVINGASLDLNGTVVIQTRGTSTVFLVIEGDVRMNLNGQNVDLIAGQEVVVAHPSDDFSVTAGLANPPQPLEYAMIRDLPVMLFDRPVLLPQPGYVSTEGLVNMRAEPNINSRLLYQVPAGQNMSVLAIDPRNEWYHIRLGNGETGWMKADLLRQNLGLVESIYSATPQPPQRFGDLGEYARVVTDQGGNLRAAPDVGFDILTTLPFGTEVRLLARSPYSPWVKVNAGDLEGWMALITLETRSAIGFLPVDYEVPLPPRPTAQPANDFYSYGGGHAYPDPNGGS